MRSTKNMDNVKGVKFCMWASQKFVTFYCVCVCLCVRVCVCVYDLVFYVCMQWI
jgi:hypothetical protein